MKNLFFTVKVSVSVTWRKKHINARALSASYHHLREKKGLLYLKSDLWETQLKKE